MELKTTTFSKLPCTNLRRAATISALQKRRLFCYYQSANSDGGTTRGYRDQAQCACGMRCFCLCQRDPTGGLLSFESAIRKKGTRGLPKKVELGTVGALCWIGCAPSPISETDQDRKAVSKKEQTNTGAIVAPVFFICQPAFAGLIVPIERPITRLRCAQPPADRS